MLKPKFHGSIPINNLSDTADVSGNTLTVGHTANATDEYFIRAYASEPFIDPPRKGAQLVEEIQARVRLFSGFSAFNCTVSDAGIVNMNRGSNFTVTWTDTALRNILGFTADLSGASTYTAPNQHMYGWYPDSPISERDGDERQAGVRTSDTQVMRAPGGQVNTITFAEFVDRTFSLGWIAKERAMAVPTDTQTTAARVKNRSYEEFWQQVGKPGRRFRWYPDATLQVGDVFDAVGAPFEYKFNEEAAKTGTSALDRSSPLMTEWYRVAFGCHAYVP
jgi:hypothetical protein